jgi:uncharacterized protein involved in exopolysaccharide biosynthesis
LRRSAEDIRVQLRENAATEKNNQQLLIVLTKAETDPGCLVATPNRLLDSHPSLRRLKDGLVDSQIRTASLLGTMAADHPRVRAAEEAEIEIGRNLHDELALARRGVEVELKMIAHRRTLLEEQLAKTNQRLQALATVRAGYANEVAETKNRAVLLERAEQNLAEARAAGASAKVASLISRIDLPDAGIKPVGPSRIVIALCGIAGGLLAGIGLVFLAVPSPVVAATSTSSTLSVDRRLVAYISRVNPVADLSAPADGPLTLTQALHKLAG